MLSQDALQQLRKPFAPEAIQWKPGATNRDKTKALALAYVDSRHYHSRLDDVVGANWSDHYEVHANGSIIVCALTVDGITRCDVGEKDAADQNTVTSAKAQAFKRACSAFGLGRYLYEFPQEWVEYNQQYRRFTDNGLRRLDATAKRHYTQLEKGTPNPTPTTRPEPDNGSEPIDSDQDAIDKLFSTVNAKTGNYYRHAAHMYNTLRKELNDDAFVWAPADDRDAYNRYYRTLVTHAKQRQLEQEQEQEQLPL